jgi:hypothetical protein
LPVAAGDEMGVTVTEVTVTLTVLLVAGRMDEVPA